MTQISSLQLFKIYLMRPVWVSYCSERWSYACDLCTALEQSQPKISRHLAMLRECGLLLDRKQGKWVHTLIPTYSFLGRSGD
jgi:ArsR family transcriptional regulator